MKSKLAALFAALLLTVSLLPVQALAAFEPEAEPPFTAAEADDPDAPEDPPSPCKVPGKPKPDPEIPGKGEYSH